MLRVFTKISVFVFALGAFSVSAEELSELAVYVRCHTQLTGKRPSLNHPLRRSVLNGSKSASLACMELLDSAKLNSSGELVRPGNAEGQEVLAHLNDFHRQWFASDSLEAAVIDQNSDLLRDREMHDETESALHVTRALFGDSVPFSETVTGSSALESLRSSGRSYEPTWDGNRGFRTNGSENARQKFRGLTTGMSTAAHCVPSGSCIDNNGRLENFETVMDAELVQTGALQGIRKVNADKLRLETKSGIGDYLSSSPGTAAVYFNDKISVHDSLGAGYLGTKSYLLLNLGRPGTMFADGGLHLARRWSRAVLTEALCKDGPPIRSADAAAYVQNNSKLPFRKIQSCMQCHASFDPLAGLARNVSIRPAPGFSGGNQRGFSSAQLAVHPIVSASQSGWTDMDSDFYKRSADGVLYFRSYSGAKTYVPINGSESAKRGLASLGTELAKTEDLYVCAAARYFQYFTGIKASLQDLEDPQSFPLTKKDSSFRDEVVKLGKSLKQHQSLRTLIEEIIDSDTYRRVDPRN